MSVRPKRWKSKDNPYVLKIVDKKHIVVFKDNKNRLHEVEVSEDVFYQLDLFELEDISQMHKNHRHIEQSELCDETLYKRMFNKAEMPDELILKKIEFKELISAVNQLPKIEKRRIKKYYFDQKTQREIAEEEHVNIRAVQYSLNIALKKLKKLLKITS